MSTEGKNDTWVIISEGSNLSDTTLPNFENDDTSAEYVERVRRLLNEKDATIEGLQAEVSSLRAQLEARNAALSLAAWAALGASLSGPCTLTSDGREVTPIECFTQFTELSQRAAIHLGDRTLFSHPAEWLPYLPTLTATETNVVDLSAKRATSSQ